MGAQSELSKVKSSGVQDTPRRSHPRHTQIEASHLYEKDENGNYANRTLIPRPTNDPNDPLTWSQWRKHLAFGCISFYVLLSNCGIAAIAPGIPGVIEEFGITDNQSSYLLSIQILMLGIGNLFWIPLSLKIGKRPVCVISSGLFFLTFIWSAAAKSYGSLLASRIISGFVGSASEAMGPAVVADLYFLHERAAMTSFYTFMIGVGSGIGGIFGGLVVNASSEWRWIFWMSAILNGVCFLSILFGYQETNFSRPLEDEVEHGSDSGLEIVKSKFNFIQSLKLFTWHDHETSFWLYLYRSIQLLLYPAVFWAALSYGVALGWVVSQLSTNSIYFPRLYNFSPLAVGNLYITNIVGALFGCLYSGPFCDWFIAFVTKRKGGYFKPEYRLWLMIPPFLFGPVGLLMWGIGLQDALHWAVPAVGTSITYGILCSVPNIGMTYVMDSYLPVSGEAMTSLTAFKNAVAFGVSFSVYPWIARSGLAHVAGYQTLIEGVIFLTTIPLFLYGEKLRRWYSKFDV